MNIKPANLALANFFSIVILSMTSCNILGIFRPNGVGLGVDGLLSQGKEEMRKGNYGNTTNDNPVNDKSPGARYYFKKAMKTAPSATEARLMHSQAVSNANLADLIYFFHFLSISGGASGLIDALGNQRETILKNVCKPIVSDLEPIRKGKIIII